MDDNNVKAILCIYAGGAAAAATAIVASTLITPVIGLGLGVGVAAGSVAAVVKHFS